MILWQDPASSIARREQRPVHRSRTVDLALSCIATWARFVVILGLTACTPRPGPSVQTSDSWVPPRSAAEWLTNPVRGAVVDIGCRCPGEFSDPPYPSTDSLRQLRGLGARTVNVQFQFAWSIFPPYEPVEEQYTLAAGALRNAQTAGLYVILSIRNGPGRNALMDSVDEEDLVTLLYTDPAARQAYLDMTRDVVRRFKDRDEIIAWEPLVEPALDYYLFDGEEPPYPRSADLWNQVAAQLIQAIRSEDEDRPILISPVNWGSTEGFRGLTRFADENIIYSLHTYDPWEYTHQFQPEGPYAGYPGVYGGQYVNGMVLDRWLAPVDEFQMLHDVPIVVGEFGGIRWLPGMDRYIGDQIANFEKRGWSWMLYAWYDAAWPERGLELQWGSRRDQLVYDADNPVFRPVVRAWQ